MNDNLAARYDALSIVREMQQLGFDVTEGEVHCFAYLACLGWMHEGRKTSNWGYGFTALYTARPYAVDLAIAMRECRTAVLIDYERDTEILRVTERGLRLLESLHASRVHEGRSNYLEPACALSLAITIPTALSALTMEPQLFGSTTLNSQRVLFDEYGSLISLAELNALSQRLPDEAGLLARMTLWVSYWAARKEHVDQDFPEHA